MNHRQSALLAAPRLLLALAVVTTLLAGCGRDSSDELIKSAREHLAKNETQAAVIQLKNVLQKQPDSVEARFLLGKALLAHIEALARKSGCDDLALDSGTQRTQAHKFYFREGMVASSFHFTKRLT